MGETYDYLFKFIIIGDAAAGKSCLLYRFTDNKFKGDSTHTIGVEFGSKVIDAGDKSLKLQIWDTAGQERFRSVTRSYYRGAAGCILVYDITSRESYNHLSTWLNDARALATSELAIVLVGNKIDLQEDREVTFLEASRFAQENDLIFLETSAKSGENVDEVFMKCAKTIVNKIESGVISPDEMGSGIQVGNAPKKPRQSGTGTLTGDGGRTGGTSSGNGQSDEGCQC